MSHYEVFIAGLLAGVMFSIAYIAYEADRQDVATLSAALGLFAVGIYLSICVF